MSSFQSTAPLAPTILNVCTLPNLPPSVRLVGAPTSTLQVGVAPWSQARSLAALPQFASPSVYALIGSAGRLGKTGDIGQRRSPQVAPDGAHRRGRGRHERALHLRYRDAP